MSNFLEIKLTPSDFSGPLDLLLHLVNSYKVDIFEVPLVSVIEQYLAFIAALKELNLELAGEYMAMASQLMLIKSRRLLPTVSDDFQEETEQLEQDLLTQIADYQQIKEVSQELHQLHAARTQFYSRPRTEIASQEVELLHSTDTIDLFLAFSQLLKQSQLDKQWNRSIVRAEIFTVAEKILEITDYLNRQPSCQFTDLFETSENKEELITTFLALLELMKTDFLRLIQDTLFGDIRLEKI